MPTLLNGWIQRSMKASLAANVRTVNTENVAMAPISSVWPGRPLTRPTAKDEHGDGERCQDGGHEGNVSDEHPVDDPRREASQNSHGGSA